MPAPKTMEILLQEENTNNEFILDSILKNVSNYKVSAMANIPEIPCYEQMNVNSKKVALFNRGYEINKATFAKGVSSNQKFLAVSLRIGICYVPACKSVLSPVIENEIHAARIFKDAVIVSSITKSGENLASMQGMVMENPLQACTDVNVFYRSLPLSARYSEKGYSTQATGNFSIYAVANCNGEGRKIFKGSFIENRSGKICKGKAEAFYENDVLNYKIIYDDASCNTQKEVEDKLFKNEFLSFSSKAFDDLNHFIPVCKNMNTAKCNLDSALSEKI